MQPPPQRRHRTAQWRRRRGINSSILLTILIAIVHMIAAQADGSAVRHTPPASASIERAQIESHSTLRRAIYGRILDVVSTDSSSASNAESDSSSSTGSQLELSSTGSAAPPSMCATGYAGTDSPEGNSCICNRGFSGPLCSVVSTDWIRALISLSPLDSRDPATVIPRAHAFLDNIESTVAGAENRTRMVGFGPSSVVDDWTWALVMFSADPSGQLTAEQLFDRFYAQTQDSSSHLRRSEIGMYIATVSTVVCPRGSCSDGRQADMFATPDPTPDAAHESASKLDLRWFLPVVIGGGVLLILLAAIGCHYRKRSAEAKAAAAQPPAAAVALRFSKYPQQGPDVISTVGGGSAIVSKSTGLAGGVGVSGGSGKVSRSGEQHPHHYDTTLAAANREISLSKRWLELVGGQLPAGGALPPRPGIKATLPRSLAGPQPPLHRLSTSGTSPITSRQTTPILPVRTLGLQPHVLISHGSGISVTELGASPSPAPFTRTQRSDGQQHSDGSQSSQLQPIPQEAVRIHMDDADDQV